MRTPKLAIALSLILFSTSYAAPSKPSSKQKTTSKKTTPLPAPRKSPPRHTYTPPASTPVIVSPTPLSEVESPACMTSQPDPITVSLEETLFPPVPAELPVAEPQPLVVTTDPPVPIADPAPRPVASFEKLFSLLEARDAKVLVETGTFRDGNSTIALGNWALNHEAHLISIDPTSIEEASIPYAQATTLICSDIPSYLENFNSSIDLLYLNSIDYEPNDPLPCQEEHLRELLAAYPFLGSTSIIMVDDSSLPGGGKGKLVIDYLLSHGWKVIAQGPQVLLSQV